MTRPYQDPDVPHPGKVFYGGKWRTLEQIERQREYDRERYANDSAYAERKREYDREWHMNDDNRLRATQLRRRRRAAAEGDTGPWGPLASTAKMLKIEREQRLLSNSGAGSDN